jgi:hypothetical protein
VTYVNLSLFIDIFSCAARTAAKRRKNVVFVGNSPAKSTVRIGQCIVIKAEFCVEAWSWVQTMTLFDLKNVLVFNVTSKAGLEDETQKGLQDTSFRGWSTESLESMWWLFSSTLGTFVGMSLRADKEKL